LKQITKSLFLDLDFLSDWMTISNCYALSRSMNLNQEIRNDLNFYLLCSLVVISISMLPKLNCYLFFLLRLIVDIMGIIKKE